MNEKPVILVVEDEAIIRIGAVQMLEDADYAVLEACNAHEAIEILNDRKDVRAVFTDVNMPGTWDGMRLARMIRRRWPPIHLIVTSGLPSHGPDNLPLNARFIRKPYDIAQVTGMLRELLGPTPSSHPINNAESAAQL
jgi:CheY-like chemotaxis protein